MGRTTPSFRTALSMKKDEWKPFRDGLSKSDKKKSDEMWDIPRLYVSACSNSVQLVPLHPIIMSILFQNYKRVLNKRSRSPSCSYCSLLDCHSGVDGIKPKCPGVLTIPFPGGAGGQTNVPPSSLLGHP